jgi:hypothetical protein
MGIKRTGGEGGILFRPLPASHGETCTCRILPCVLAGYKRFRSSGTVSIVSLIRCNSRQNGITGISEIRVAPVRTRSPDLYRAVESLSGTAIRPTLRRQKSLPEIVTHCPPNARVVRPSILALEKFSFLVQRVSVLDVAHDIPRACRNCNYAWSFAKIQMRAPK